MTSQLCIDVKAGDLTSDVFQAQSILVILSSSTQQHSNVLKYIESRVDLGCKEVVFAGDDSQNYLCFVEEELLEKVMSQKASMLSLPNEEIQEITSLLLVSLLSQKFANKSYIAIEVLGEINLSLIEGDLRKPIGIIS